MRRFFSLFALLTPLVIAPNAMAKPATLTVTVDGIHDGGTIPDVLALCVPTNDGKSGPGRNMRPAIHWSGAPKGTQSFAVFMVDTDVPADFSDAGKDGKIIAADAKRRDFFHYGVIDIPADVTNLSGGETGSVAASGRELVTDLGAYVPTPTQFGGPCPPWNDKRLHHYHFHVLALSSPHVTLPKDATAAQAWAKLAPTALAHGELIGTYSLHMPMRAQ